MQADTLQRSCGIVFTFPVFSSTKIAATAAGSISGTANGKMPACSLTCRISTRALLFSSGFEREELREEGHVVVRGLYVERARAAWVAGRQRVAVRVERVVESDSVQRVAAAQKRALFITTRTSLGF